MKARSKREKLRQAGTALALTMIMTAIALAVLAGAMTWSVNSTRMTYRSIQHTRSVAAAEAATEMVLSKMTRDYLSGGEQQVDASLAAYRLIVPKSSDSSYWDRWQFDDGQGDFGQTYVQITSASNYVVLNSTYAGLKGFVTTYDVVSHARDTASPQEVVGGVLQELQLARIPVFQFAMYSSANMEISCGQPFTITGRVHANNQLYIEPDSLLTFESDVTAVGDILFQRDPLDTRGDPVGAVVYEAEKNAFVAAMTLPIGTTNTPEAIREIIQPPPATEDPNSPLGKLRYYNQADMLLTVSDSGISATSGKFDNFATVIPSNQVAAIVTTTNRFWDAREQKTVRPIDIDIGALTAWSQTNTSLRPALWSRDLSSVYVWDRRTLASTNLGAVRLVNGKQLPGLGLTVATARPLYVLGDYNQTNSSYLGTTNTSNTRPASIVADAVTILSKNWSDTKSTISLGLRPAKNTTVNAAILTGVVETTAGHYSGGMENFPRFLEAWGSGNVFTYNGSMVKMFPSLYATNVWGLSGVYDPPARNWAYDVNFNNASKLPPLTPSLQKVLRGRWATVAANQNTAPVSP